MNSKKYIQRFIEQLSEANIKDYTSIISNFDYSQIDFSIFENWQSNAYTRNCFYRDDHFELILICWDKDLQTPIHDHDGEDCWVYILKGEMEEEFYELTKQGALKLLSLNSLKPFQLTKSNGVGGFHRLRNTSKGRSLSLHVYAKPIEHSCFYDENSGEFVKKELSYNTFKPLNSLVDIN